MSKRYLFILMCLGVAANVVAQSSQDELAAKLQNPLARIVAMPVQHNIGIGTPGLDGSSYTMLFQPIVAKAYDNFSIIHRGVFGLSYLPASTSSSGNTYGVTDLNYSFYYSPKNESKLSWGIGPSIDMPTASSEMLGNGKWNVGASIVMVYQSPKWTFDMVFRQTTSVAGDSERDDVNLFVGQTLIARSLGKGWVVNTFPTFKANWSAPKGQKWTVPVGGGLNKLVFLGKLPVNLGVQYYSNVVRPDYAPKSELRFITTFVFAK